MNAEHLSLVGYLATASARMFCVAGIDLCLIVLAVANTAIGLLADRALYKYNLPTNAREVQLRSYIFLPASAAWMLVVALNLLLLGWFVLAFAGTFTK
jgi:hypothetical protein